MFKFVCLVALLVPSCPEVPIFESSTGSPPNDCLRNTTNKRQRGIALPERPESGTEHCRNVLATDCSGYADEPVCAHDGGKYVTYMNSCEFAHGICSHNGHSLHVTHLGPCT